MHEIGNNMKCRQMSGLGGNIPEDHIDRISVKEPHYRECGLDLPFRDITKLTGDETALGNKEFDHPGPDVANEGPMPVEHTSSIR
jgi:hypothetical protein